MPRKIDIFDSTLRDGAQGEGISFTLEDKMQIIHALDKLGVSYIELGNLAGSPAEAEFFAGASRLTLTHATLVAFGSTCRKDLAAADDPALAILANSFPECVTIYGKSSRFHVTTILGTSLVENLRMIRDSVSFLKQHGKRVFYDAEHFFDGFQDNADYALETLKAAHDGGADLLVLCDTNGGNFPLNIERITQLVSDRFQCPIGIHCHNDCGIAVANSLAAVQGGVDQVQGTFLGFGERCGNANLSTLIPILQLKNGYHCIENADMITLTPTARFIAEIANIPLLSSLPFVGTSAFAHKAGTHADGVSKATESFEQISPAAVGNERRFLVSDIAGRSSFMNKVHAIRPDLPRTHPLVTALMQSIKALEAEGYQFEAADATLDLIIRKQLGLYTPFFELVGYKIINEHRIMGTTCTTATIKVKVGDHNEISAAEGEGPVHALDRALRRALHRFFPALASAHLTDYKVRVLNPGSGVAAKVRVLITSTDGKAVWSTVGVSTDIIEASWLALVDAVEHKLTHDECAGPVVQQQKTTLTTLQEGVPTWA